MSFQFFEYRVNNKMKKIRFVFLITFGPWKNDPIRTAGRQYVGARIIQVQQKMPPGSTVSGFFAADDPGVHAFMIQSNNLFIESAVNYR